MLARLPQHAYQTFQIEITIASAQTDSGGLDGKRFFLHKTRMALTINVERHVIRVVLLGKVAQLRGRAQQPSRSRYSLRVRSSTTIAASRSR